MFPSTKITEVGTSDTDLFACPITLSGVVETLVIFNKDESETVNLSLKFYTKTEDVTKEIIPIQIAPGGYFIFPKTLNFTSEDRIIAIADIVAPITATLSLYTDQVIPGTITPPPTGSVVATLDNLLLNGNFQIAQEGDIVIPAGGTANTLDMFVVHNGTDQSVTVTRESHVPGQLEVPGNPRHKMRLDLAIAPTSGEVRVFQRIESVYTLSGMDGSVRAYFTGPVGTEAMACEVVQGFGTGGSPSGDTTTAATTLDIPLIHDVSTQVRKVTFNVPSILGKTLGTDDNDYLELAWTLTPRQAGNYEISRMSFVKGDSSSLVDPYEDVDPHTMLDRCQDFLRMRMEPDQNFIWSSDITTSNSYLGRIDFGRAMRGIPHMTLAGHSAEGFIFGAVVANSVTAEGFRYTNISSTTKARGFFALNYKADARLWRDP